MIQQNTADKNFKELRILPGFRKSSVCGSREKAWPSSATLRDLPKRRGGTPRISNSAARYIRYVIWRLDKASRDCIRPPRARQLALASLKETLLHYPEGAERWRLKIFPETSVSLSHVRTAASLARESPPAVQRAELRSTANHFLRTPVLSSSTECSRMKLVDPDAI